MASPKTIDLNVEHGWCESPLIKHLYSAVAVTKFLVMNPYFSFGVTQWCTSNSDMEQLSPQHVRSSLSGGQADSERTQFNTRVRNEQWCQNSGASVHWHKRQRSQKLTGFVVFFTSIFWMISVDMLVIRIVERCFRSRLNYFIPLKKLNYCTNY